MTILYMKSHDRMITLLMFSASSFSPDLLIILLHFLIAVTTLLLCFSLPRNWYKLTSETQNSELSRDLRSINAFRTICMFGVICAHCALANNMCPQLNPYYIEQVRSIIVHFNFISQV